MMRDVVKIFKALSDPNRLRILKMLEIRSLCVCEIASVLGLANSTVSKHLSLLADAGLIDSVKDGKWVNYSIPLERRQAMVEEILPLVMKWLAGDEIIQADQKKVATVDRYCLP